MTERKQAAARFIITWLPLIVVLVGTSMVLLDFSFMLAAGFAGALIFAALARSALREKPAVTGATTS